MGLSRSKSRRLSGRGGAGLAGQWTGTGITSSTAAAAIETAPDSRSLGYAENATLPLGAYTTFHGAAVDNTSILIAYTRTGDANLDGVVNDDDVTIVGATYAPGVPQPHWRRGDFDYNGFVDNDDVTLLGAFYDPSATPLGATLHPPSPSVAAVPEPNALLLLCLGLAGVCAMRRLELNTATKTAAHLLTKRAGAIWKASPVETAKRRSRPLQVCPRGVLFRSIPIAGQN